MRSIWSINMLKEIQKKCMAMIDIKLFLGPDIKFAK